MASDSSDDTETKERVGSPCQREESNTAAAAAATESPPLAGESEIIEVEVHGPPEAGGRNPSAATATAATAEQKGKEAVSLFWSAWGSVGDKPPPPPPPSSPSRPPSHPPPRPRSRPPPFLSRTGVSSMFDLKDVFDELMLECQGESSGKTDQKAEAEGTERSGETDQKAEAEGTRRQENEQAKSLALVHRKDKKPLWRKFLDRIGISNQNYTSAYVNYQKVHITELIRHYNLLEMVAGRGVEFHAHALNLRNNYSEFRPVHGDGECFYRSFIFSYLEQVLDRQDTHEEHRVLAAVKGVARQHARLGWASEFSRSQKAFKKMIKKVMRWKTHRRWKNVPTINSYRIEKLLELFNHYNRTNDIFTFLRLVAAIWICSHSEEFVPLIPELNEGYTLKEWCFREVVQRKVFTDHIQMTALVRALRVPLRVEHLFHEAGLDLYIGQDSQDDMPRSTCWPLHRHQVPPDHQVPRVTVLYTQEHYDIIYPYHPEDSVTSGESSDLRSDKTQIGSSSGETSSQQIDRVEGSTSTGEKSNKHTAEGES